MPDEIIGLAEEEPDLSDLAMVVINVETREGRQLSFAVGLEAPEDHLSMIVDSGYGADFTETAFTIKRVTR